MVYREISQKLGIDPVTQRRVSDIISELEALGILSARVVNRGRYGKTRILKITVNPSTLIEIFIQDPLIRDYVERELENLLTTELQDSYNTQTIDL